MDYNGFGIRDDCLYANGRRIPIRIVICCAVKKALAIDFISFLLLFLCSNEKDVETVNKSIMVTAFADYRSGKAIKIVRRNKEDKTHEKISDKN